MSADRPRSSASPPAGREVGGAFLGGLILAVVATWPLVLRLGSTVPGDLGDPLLQTWQLAWSGHAWLPGGTPLLDTNAWFPLADTFAFSDPPLGYAPLAMGIASVADALLRYHLAFLLAFTLAWWGPYLLARELGTGRIAATVAGAAAAYAPWRLSQVGHLHILSTGGIAISLWLLVRGYRTQRPGVVLAGWAVAVWQLCVSLGLGVPFGTLLGVLVVVVAVGWLRAGRPPVPRALVGASVAGVTLLGATVLWRALPYLRVAAEHPESARTVAVLELYSPPPIGLLTAPATSWLWGGATAAWRESLRFPAEQTLHVGLVVVLLALVGVGAVAWRRSLRFGLAAGVVVTGVLALGVTVAGGRFTYLPLFELAPGWDAIRTPGRVVMLTSLGLGLLGAMGVHRIQHALDRRTSRLAALGIAGALALAVHVEGAGTIELLDPPEPPDVTATAPILHLPSSGSVDGRYLFWSTGAGYPEIVNGFGAFTPDLLTQVREATETFPDPASVSLLRELGVRSVVWHAELADGTPWSGVGFASVQGLDVRRRQHGPTVVFDLG